VRVRFAPQAEQHRERRSLSPEMALRLSALFGNSPEFWLNLQGAVALWDARAAVNDGLRKVARKSSSTQGSGPSSIAGYAPTRVPSRPPKGILPPLKHCYRPPRGAGLGGSPCTCG